MSIYDSPIIYCVVYLYFVAVAINHARSTMTTMLQFVLYVTTNEFGIVLFFNFAPIALCTSLTPIGSDADILLPISV